MNADERMTYQLAEANKIAAALAEIDDDDVFWQETDVDGLFVCVLCGAECIEGHDWFAHKTHCPWHRARWYVQEFLMKPNPGSRAKPLRGELRKRALERQRALNERLGQQLVLDRDTSKTLARLDRLSRGLLR